MARPRSEHRRAALLEAATEVIAEQGIGAPTSQISRRAGVSEGSLFTYFPTKDALHLALYRELKLDLSAALAQGFPRHGSVRERLEHMFRAWVGWGVDRAASREALRRLSVSNTIVEQSRAAAAPAYAELDRLRDDAAALGMLADIPPEMAAATLKAIANMTMDLIAAAPEQRERYLQSGFDVLWGALVRGK